VVGLERDKPAPDRAAGRKGPALSGSLAMAPYAIALIMLGVPCADRRGHTDVAGDDSRRSTAKLRQTISAAPCERSTRPLPTQMSGERLASLAKSATRIAYLAGELQPTPAPEDAVGIGIPRIGASYVVDVNGPSHKPLRAARAC